jgi:hypothetical protein
MEDLMVQTQRAREMERHRGESFRSIDLAIWQDHVP